MLILLFELMSTAVSSQCFIYYGRLTQSIGLAPTDLTLNQEIKDISSLIEKKPEEVLAIFAKWLNTPDPQALLNSSIFFDMRLVHGSKGLFNVLQEDVLARCKNNELFL